MLTCFVIMPFGKQGTEEYSNNLKTYHMLIKPTVQECGYNCLRADEVDNIGSITKDIIEYIYKSDLVIADLSGRNANVYYELGVRHALCPYGTIPIIKKGELLPFDIMNYRAIFYTTEYDGPEIFKQELKRKISAISKIDNRVDNPVFDILGKSIKASVDLDKYVLKDIYINKQNELDTYIDLLGKKQKELDSLITKEAIWERNENEIKKMLISLFINKLRIIILRSII